MQLVDLTPDELFDNFDDIISIKFDESEKYQFESIKKPDLHRNLVDSFAETEKNKYDDSDNESLDSTYRKMNKRTPSKDAVTNKKKKKSYQSKTCFRIRSVKMDSSQQNPNNDNGNNIFTSNTNQEHLTHKDVVPGEFYGNDSSLFFNNIENLKNIAKGTYQQIKGGKNFARNSNEEICIILPEQLASSDLQFSDNPTKQTKTRKPSTRMMRASIDNTHANLPMEFMNQVASRENTVQDFPSKQSDIQRHEFGKSYNGAFRKSGTNFVPGEPVGKIVIKHKRDGSLNMEKLNEEWSKIDQMSRNGVPSKDSSKIAQAGSLKITRKVTVGVNGGIQYDRANNSSIFQKKANSKQYNYTMKNVSGVIEPNPNIHKRNTALDNVCHDKNQMDEWMKEYIDNGSYPMPQIRDHNPVYVNPKSQKNDPNNSAVQRQLFVNKTKRGSMLECYDENTHMPNITPMPQSNLISRETEKSRVSKNGRDLKRGITNNPNQGRNFSINNKKISLNTKRETKEPRLSNSDMVDDPKYGGGRNYGNIMK